MTFLSKLASVLLKITQLVVSDGPLIGQMIPKAQAIEEKVVSEFQQLGQVVVMAEAFGQTLSIKGPDKLKAAAPLAAQIVLQSALMAGKKIENAALFQQGSTKLADGMADILNSFKAEIAAENQA